MKKIILIIACIVATFTSVNAQSTLKTLNYTLDATIANGVVAPSLSVTKNFSLSSKKSTKFKIGTGVRLSMINGGNSLNYITAPAILTSGKKGPGVFFAEQIVSNIDSFSYSKTSINALNLLINLNYAITRKFAVEFNIDAIGYSFGKEQDATLLNATAAAPLIKTTKASPTAINALLISDNDLGSLNSQFNVQYKATSNITAKLGAGFLFSEYTNSVKTIVNNPLALNDRYRNKSLGLVIGATYSFTKPTTKADLKTIEQ